MAALFVAFCAPCRDVTAGHTAEDANRIQALIYSAAHYFSLSFHVRSTADFTTLFFSLFCVWPFSFTADDAKDLSALCSHISVALENIKRADEADEVSMAEKNDTNGGNSICFITNGRLVYRSVDKPPRVWIIPNSRVVWTHFPPPLW